MNAHVRRNWPPAKGIETPHKKAQQEWDRRMGGAIAQATNWRLGFMVAMGAMLLCIAGLIYLGAQPKAVPHIVEVDKLGAATYRGPVGQAAGAFTPSEALVKYHLRRWVNQVRSVPADGDVLKRSWEEAYASVTERAANYLQAYAEKARPHARAGRGERITLEVTAIVPVTGNTWQVDWREYTWDELGNKTSDELWRGMFTVLIRPPASDEAQLIRNPIGFYLDDINWAPVSTPRAAN